MTETKTPSPLGRLGREVGGIIGAAGKRGATKLTGKVTGKIKGKVGDLTDRLTEYATGEKSGLSDLGFGEQRKDQGKEQGGEEKKEGFFKRLGHGVKGVTELFKAFTGKGGKGKGNRKVVNIVESIDIGAPLQVVYNQWTQFEEFPSFMKKVERVSQDEDTKLTWKAQVFWSHRTWQADIVEQVPDRHIIWRSHGAKGHVDGTVTFSELAPNLTRVLVVLEYHPQGLFEKTGNIWRAQGRRARLELKHFRRQVMTQTLLRADDVPGWRGEIHDGEVTSQPDEEQTTSSEEQATEAPEAPPPGSGEEPEAPKEGEETAEPEEETEGQEEEERVPEGQVSARG
ncbi:cyclase [Herbidospora sp. NEAU-GS84]|uniref:Cyclase n=1 Tax=Herbidospora solisilvae TaxID=2696284 RepID=A0A7C9J7J7_9ACTN|nr:SRPBCC family protein [Herbidospora solisilvae]NAS21748.1 cyclase [Herbidospora solisilvae]